MSCAKRCSFRLGLNVLTPHVSISIQIQIQIQNNIYLTVGERTVALKIIARCAITQTPTEPWNTDNIAD